MKFLDLVRALESFFADKPDAIIWLDFISKSQYQFAPSDRPPQWWQNTFRLAIGQMGQMVMVMTPWDNPIALTRAWCLYELYACCSSGSRFSVAFPPCERARFIAEIVASGDAFFDMLGKVNTEKSECSRATDRQRIFSAVQSLAGGFSALDRGVLSTMTEWLSSILGLACIHVEQGQFDRARQLHEECLSKRRAVHGADLPIVLVSMVNLARVCLQTNDLSFALELYNDCYTRSRLVNGDDHPNTLSYLSSLASCYRALGQSDLASGMFEKCYAGECRVLAGGRARKRNCISVQYGQCLGRVQETRPRSRLVPQVPHPQPSHARMRPPHHQEVRRVRTTLPDATGFLAVCRDQLKDV